MLNVENISISFGKRRILNDISFDLNEGSITTITGKSGSGKTTLLGIISGLLEPDRGRVLFEGKNIFRWFDFQRSHFRNRKIGFVFQFFNLLPDLTAYQNIIYPATIPLLPKNVRSDADFLIDFLDIREIIHQHPSTLSGGERQRVAIARALIMRPKLVLADEPTGNLDNVTAEYIKNLFLEIRDRYNISFLITTHDERFVENAEQRYHLESGSLSEFKKSVSRSKIPGESTAEKSAGKKKTVKKKTSKKGHSK